MSVDDDVKEAVRLETALQLALMVHHGQRDKVGAPYILHVLDVWIAIRSDGGSVNEQIVALLHDAIEDAPDHKLAEVTSAIARFGPEVYHAVDAITKHKAETREQYLERVTRNPIARVVKIEDARNNLERADNISDEKERLRLRMKYEKTVNVLSAANQPGGE